MKYKINVLSKRLLSDTVTPVNIYLKLRDVFAGSILLESSDYRGQENSLSLVCCDPISSFTVENGTIKCVFPDGKQNAESITERGQLIRSLNEFRNSFELEKQVILKFTGSGLFGFMTYDSVRYLEDIRLPGNNSDGYGEGIPDMVYKLYRYVIVVDHFRDELTLIQHTSEVQPKRNGPEGLEWIQQLIYSNRFSTYSFGISDKEVSTISDDEYMEMVKKGKSHCDRGDVFQLVLSRKFSIHFKGDEFNVYRSLRSINPSPYLFYFDYGNFKLFGSSPEAQLQVKGKVASIYPIAGTFRRTGNDQEDAELANKLASDEKENAEHNMLVDLARNDLSRHAKDVSVEVFREIQFYSHVIHLVSKVSGKLIDESALLNVVADTFPAGTLSGAPKHMAMTLINRYEKTDRGFYGGAIGYIGFNNDYNHAIMIRTFLSKDNRLTYQAGAGIVSKSRPENELQEVNNKIEALRKAVSMAENI